MKAKKTQNITTVLSWFTSILKELKASQLINLIDNKEKVKESFLELIFRWSKSLKENTSLQHLKDNAKSWGWSQQHQDGIGQNMTIVPTPKDVWSLPDKDLLDVVSNRFGEATITAEELPFSLDDIDTSYRVLTEQDLFPKEKFVGMTVMKSIRKFIYLVDRLNQKSIKKTGRPRYYIPGLETQQFFHNNEGKIPGFMKDGNWYYYPAASFRNHNGYLDVPCSIWNGSSLSRNGRYVGDVWYSDDRFLVLEIILKP